VIPTSQLGRLFNLHDGSAAVGSGVEVSLEIPGVFVDLLAGAIRLEVD
jgi:hypothetical protein